MWMLTPEHCAAVPRGKAKNVLFTLTAYRCDPSADRAMIRMKMWIMWEAGFTAAYAPFSSRNGRW